MAASAGSLTKLCVEPGASAHTFDTNSEPYRFWNVGLKRRGTIIDPNTIQGTRSHPSERTRSGPSLTRGPITMPASPLDLDAWLQRAMGGTKTVNAIAVADTVPWFGVLVQYYSGKTIEYKDCKLDRLILQGNAHQEGQEPEPISMSLDIVGLTTAVDTSYPSLTLGTAAGNYPYTFCDATTSQVSSSRTIRAFTLVIDNHIRPIWGNGSCTPTDLMESDRTVVYSVYVPFTSANADLYAQSAAGTTGTLVLTNGSLSCTFTFGVLQAPIVGPSIEHKGEVLLPITYVARKVSSTMEIAVSNVSS